MAKYLSDAAIDGGLDYWGTNVDRLFVCSGEPSSYADAATVKDLATHVLTAGDFSKAAGDTSGRKVTLAAQPSITIDHDGTPAYIAFGISSSSTLVGYTTCTGDALVAGNLVNVPSFDVTEIADPT